MNRLAVAPLAPGRFEAVRRDGVPWRRALLDRLLAPRVAVVAACILSLPAVGLGLAVDDFWHRTMLFQDRPGFPLHGGPLSLFGFASGDPAEHAQALEAGFFPWWASSELRMTFFRPMTATQRREM
jgi:hypothetical protein